MPHRAFNHSRRVRNRIIISLHIIIYISTKQFTYTIVLTTPIQYLNSKPHIYNTTIHIPSITLKNSHFKHTSISIMLTTFHINAYQSCNFQHISLI